LSYSKEVIDIVQFGSSSLEGKKPNDIDIAVIFNKIPLKEQLNQAQEIKKQIEKFSEIPVHVISFDFYSLFDSSNFAKEGILFYGKSIIHCDNFAERLGFIPKVLIFYNLTNLEKKDKIRFNYMLNGKKGEYGLLRKYGGRILKPGLIEVEPEFENVFVEEIKKFKVEYAMKRILN